MIIYILVFVIRVATVGADGYTSDSVLSEDIYSWGPQLKQRSFDAVFDAFGISRRSESSGKHSIIICRKLLKPYGRIFSVGPLLWAASSAILASSERSSLRSIQLLESPSQRDDLLKMIMDGSIPYHVEGSTYCDSCQLEGYFNTMQCPENLRNQVIRLSPLPAYHFTSVHILVEQFKQITDILEALLADTKKNPYCLHSFTIRRSPNDYEMENWLIGELWTSYSELNAYRNTVEFRKHKKRLVDLGVIAFAKVAVDCCDVLLNSKIRTVNSDAKMDYSAYFVQINPGCDAKFYHQVRMKVPEATADASCLLFSMGKVISEGAETNELVFVHIILKNKSVGNELSIKDTNKMEPFQDYCKFLVQFSFVNRFTFKAIQYDRSAGGSQANNEFNNSFEVKEVAPSMDLTAKYAMIKVISASASDLDIKVEHPP